MTDMIRGNTKKLLVYGAALVILIWVAFPLLWLVKSSISPPVEMMSIPPDIVPHHPTLGYYTGLFHDVAGIDPGTGQQHLIPRALLNSLIISTAVLLINVLAGAPAAYVIARYHFPLRGFILNGMLASRMVPALVLLVPFYLLFRRAGLIDSLAGIIIADTAISVPFTIWILRGHFDSVPLEIEKAARVDGCARLRVFWQVALPLAAPGLVVAGLFTFLLAWNEFPLALVLSQSANSLPVQPALAGLSSYQGISYGFLFAGSVLAAAPPAFLALFLQRYLTRGLLEGSVK